MKPILRLAGSNFDATQYTNVLGDVLNNNLNLNYAFMHDNAPIHTSNVVKEFINKHRFANLARVVTMLAGFKSSKTVVRFN